MPTKRLVVRVPDDIKAWLEQQAHYYGGTLGSEVSKSCRQRMEQEVETKRRDAQTSAGSAKRSDTPRNAGSAR